jgi:hypothetical protein
VSSWSASSEKQAFASSFRRPAPLRIWDTAETALDISSSKSCSLRLGTAGQHGPPCPRQTEEPAVSQPAFREGFLRSSEEEAVTYSICSSCGVRIATHRDVPPKHCQRCSPTRHSNTERVRNLLRETKQASRVAA